MTQPTVSDDQSSNENSTSLAFQLNGNPVETSVHPATRLNVLLRETFRLTGTKTGCDAGDCGACSVLVNDEVVCACMVPSGRLANAQVTTVEGLPEYSEMAGRLQRAFHHYGAAQCGICTPGMLVSAVALLQRCATPTEEQVEDALGGVLCRCTGYRKIVTAVCSAHNFSADNSKPKVDSVVGEKIPRLDGEAKILGTDRFGGDEVPADCLVLKVIRSPYHHASFEFGDIESFIEHSPGIEAVFRAKDIPGVNEFGVIPPFRDQPVFAENVARFQGEAVAAVVGQPQAIETFNSDEFPITFKSLMPVLTPSEAQEDKAPLLHAGRSRNELTTGLVQRGDLDAAFADAEIEVSGNFTTGFVEHAYIEPEAGYAKRVGNRIEIYGCTQAPYMDREAIARILNIDEQDIRILPSAVGGGFGSKLDLSFQPFLALAAWQLNRPVRVTYTRPESMLSTTKRHPSEIKARIAASKDGRIAAMDFYGEFNTGAYASWGPTVANRVPVHASGPYKFEAYRARSKAIHTHCAPAGAFRGFGVPQSAIAQESLFDELADKLAIDRLDFRIDNAIGNGDATVTGQVFSQGVGIRQCLEELRPRWRQLNEEVAAFNRQALETNA
ncbi:MAG: molybdopterin cofactor-binding domain-containing protein, partial [Gammaproteobacteria bacterium]